MLATKCHPCEVLLNRNLSGLLQHVRQVALDDLKLFRCLHAVEPCEVKKVEMVNDPGSQLVRPARMRGNMKDDGWRGCLDDTCPQPLIRFDVIEVGMESFLAS